MQSYFFAIYFLPLLGLYQELKNRKANNEPLTKDEERKLAIFKMFDRREIEKAREDGVLKTLAWKRSINEPYQEEEARIFELMEEYGVPLPNKNFKVRVVRR